MAGDALERVRELRELHRRMHALSRLAALFRQSPS
jgi:hypothetical protein